MGLLWKLKLSLHFILSLSYWIFHFCQHIGSQSVYWKQIYLLNCVFGVIFFFKSFFCTNLKTWWHCYSVCLNIFEIFTCDFVNILFLFHYQNVLLFFVFVLFLHNFSWFILWASLEKTFVRYKIIYSIVLFSFYLFFSTLTHFCFLCFCFFYSFLLVPIISHQWP